VKKLLRHFLALATGIFMTVAADAQADSGRGQPLDSFLLRQRGWLGDLARNLLAEAPDEEGLGRSVRRNDDAFQRYRGLVIRRIVVQRVDFGVSISDTTKRLINTVTRILDAAHSTTSEKVVRHNLFFTEGDRLSPPLLGASERHLRDLAYLQEARITVRRVRTSRDSVDVLVITKDAFSLGGGLNFHEIDRVEGQIQEDNVHGSGDKALVSGFYDRKRSNPVGYGFEYVKRNIGGSFIDASIGFQDYRKSFSSNKYEEKNSYIRLIKPLVNPYMKWTYAIEAGMRETTNQYWPDSLYQAEYRYRYRMLDTWAGWNFTADKASGNNRDNRLNWLIGARFLERGFQHRPLHSDGLNFYRYTDRTAVLGALSVFRQTFYKTQYIYGFGRNEDVPEGVDASIVGGWTRTAGRERPYVGVDLQRYYFNRGDHYFSYTVRAGTYFYGKRAEDISVLAGLDYFSRLHLLNSRWKQRSFAGISAARQWNYRLTEPLFLESAYGLPLYDNRSIGGDARVTIRGESVFFSPWTLAWFHLAPFAFGSATLFHYPADMVEVNTIYPSVGGGLRLQNESLVFGTIEVKAAYYPKPDLRNQRWRLELGTNIRFRYNREFIKRPELVGVN
jgi:hypothetical protein